MRKTCLSATLSLLIANIAVADAPKVSTDIPPVQSLVARVMQGVGEPSSIIPPGGSPHHYAMRPSDAQKIADADVIFHIGGLVPWIEPTVEKLAPDAKTFDLMDVEGMVKLDARTEHDHGDEPGHDEHGRGDEHGHDDDHDEKKEADAKHDHDDHDHDHDKDKQAKAKHDHDHDDAHSKDDHAEHEHDKDDHAEDAHSGEAVDAHGWLDPRNAAVWMAAMAKTLGELDPDNADLYAKNAKDGAAELEALEDKLAKMLAPVKGGSFLVYHDSTQYFEVRFGLKTLGTVTETEDAPPSAEHIAEIRDLIADTGKMCLILEPGPEPRLVKTLSEDRDVVLGVADPLGREIEPGPAAYPQLLTDMATGFAECLAKLK